MSRFDPRLTDRDPVGMHAAACKGKEGFANGARAHRVARERRKRRGVVRIVYRCPFCRQFHIATKGKED